MRIILVRRILPLCVGAALWLAACGPGDERGGTGPGIVDPRVARLGLSGTSLGEGLEKPGFVLTDTRGEQFDFRKETAGFLTLLFFGYTNCPDICPGHLASIAAALGDLPSELRSRIRVVFVGVDVPRDTPERMRQWLDRFDPDFVGLTGTPDQIEAAQIASAVPPAFVDAEWEGGYSVGHASWVLVYTTDDRAHLRYRFGVGRKEWAHDLEVLAREGWPAA
jgi:protein SCO1/2